MNIEKLILLAILIGEFSVLLSQTPEWQWIERGGGLATWSPSVSGKADDQVTSLEVDVRGNVYVTANLVKSITVTIGNTKIKSMRGYFDGVVAKFDCDGNLLWNVVFGGKNTDGLQDVVVDSLGNVYVTGSIHAGYTATDSAYIGDSAYYFRSQRAVVAKLDSNGNLKWKHIAYYNEPPGQGSQGQSIGIDKHGYVYVYGYTYVDSGMFSPKHSLKWGDYLAKYSVNGNLIWVKQIKEYGNPMRYLNMEVDHEGNCLFGGNIIDTLEIGGQQFNMSNSHGEAFVMELDSSGQFVWGDVSVSPLFGSVSDIAIDKRNPNSTDFYLAGNTAQDLSFGNVSITTSQLTGLGYLVKYENRVPVWMKYSLSKTSSAIYGVDVDSYGNVYAVTQSPDGSSNIEIGGMNLTTDLRSPIIASFKSNGDTLFKSYINSSSKWGFATEVKSGFNHNLYIGGSFSHQLNIRNDSIYYVGGGYTDMFIAKYGIENCEDTTTVKPPDTSSSVEYINQYSFLRVYPNPSTGSFYVDTERRAKGQLSIYNQLGEEVYSERFSDVNQTIINLSPHLTNGVYILRYIGEEEVVTVKVILRR